MYPSIPCPARKKSCRRAFRSLGSTCWLLASVLVACELPTRPPAGQAATRTSTPLLPLDELRGLRTAPFPLANRYLQARGWRRLPNVVYKDQECVVQYWVLPAPRPGAPADTLTRAVYLPDSLDGLGNLLNYQSPRRLQYALVLATARARRLPLDGHSSLDSTLWVYNGPGEHIGLVVEADQPGARYQISLQYRDPSFGEEPPPPPPPDEP